MTDELPLLPRVAKGDRAAVAECLNRYQNLVWSLARRSCRDRESAEDAVQDVFLKLWRIADRFDENVASETTFVAMIARRTLIDLSRKRSWNTTSLATDQISNSEMEVSVRAELNDEAAKASAMLERLPGDQKNVIQLSIYEGLSHSGIAKATGLSLGTVKTHIRRGMLKLRNALFSEDELAVGSSQLKESRNE